MVRLEYFQIHMHQATSEQQLDHVEFYIIVHDDDERYNYEHNLRHDNDWMLYFQTMKKKKKNCNNEKKSFRLTFS